MSTENSAPQEPLPASADTEALTTVGWVSYVLHLIVAVGALIPGAQFSPLLLIVALVIDLVKREDANNEAVGRWQASHFSWRIRTVLLAVVLYLLTAPLWFFFLLPGWLAWTAISVWFLYRIVLGMTRLNKERPMELTA